MSVSYKPLWKLLIDKDMNKKALSDKIGISKSTIDKMNHDEYIALSIVDRICNFFDCDISDIIKHEREIQDGKNKE